MNKKSTNFAQISPVSIFNATNETPFIASIPHSSTFIPEELKYLYTDEHLNRLRNTDWFLQELYDFLPDIGIDTIQANFNRYVIDANRGKEQEKGGQIYRTSLVYTRDTWGDPILKDDTCDLQIDFRIRKFYDPFHAALQKQIQRKIQKFGRAYLIDLHSFAVAPHPSGSVGGYRDTGADLYLGAGDFSEKGPFLKALLARTLNTQGFSVSESVRFPGGNIVRKYGEQSNVEACMFELKYTTYMPDYALKSDRIPEIHQERYLKTKGKLKRALMDVIIAQKPSYNHIQTAQHLSL